MLLRVAMCQKSDQIENSSYLKKNLGLQSFILKGFLAQEKSCHEDHENNAKMNEKLKF